MNTLARWRGWALAGAVLCFAILTWMTHGPLDVTDFGTFDAPSDYRYDVVSARAYLDVLRDTPGATRMYLVGHQVVDLAFPVLFTLSLIGCIWASTGHLNTATRWAMVVLPVVYMVTDLSENAGVAAVIKARAGVPDADILAVRFLTNAKMVLFIAAAGLTLILWWRHRRAQTAGGMK